MKYIRCTRCELNYRTEDEDCCKVCLKELKGESEYEPLGPEGDICPFCDENILPYGEDMCGKCAFVHAQRNTEENALPIKNKINFIEIDK